MAGRTYSFTVPSLRCSRPQHLFRFWHVYEVSRWKNRVLLFCHFTPPTKYPPICDETSPPVNCSLACTFSTGFRYNARHSCVQCSTFFSNFSRYWMQPPGWYSRCRGSTTSARCFADFTYRITYKVAVLAYKCQHSLVPAWWATSTSRHWIQTTTIRIGVRAKFF